MKKKKTKTTDGCAYTKYDGKIQFMCLDHEQYDLEINPSIIYRIWRRNETLLFRKYPRSEKNLTFP